MAWKYHKMTANVCANGVLICNVSRGRYITESERNVIGRVLAAAPDMLAALKWFIEFCDEHEDWTTDSLCNGRDDSAEAIWLQSARAAIAKAEGRA